MSAGIAICLLCYTPRMPKKEEVYRNYDDDSSDGTESRRQGRNHGSRQAHRELASEEEERRSSQNIEEQSAQNKVIETAFRLEQAMEKMSLIMNLLEVNLEPGGR